MKSVFILISGLNLMEDVMKNLSTYISCFEFDKFEPIATEYEMEEKGIRCFIKDVFNVLFDNHILGC